MVRVSTPLPDFVSATLVAEPFSIRPAKVVLELLPPTVRTGVPLAVLVINPPLAPAIDPADTE